MSVDFFIPSCVPFQVKSKLTPSLPFVVDVPPVVPLLDDIGNSNSFFWLLVRVITNLVPIFSTLEIPTPFSPFRPWVPLSPFIVGIVNFLFVPLDKLIVISEPTFVMFVILTPSLPFNPCSPCNIGKVITFIESNIPFCYI